jgi:alcohol dehydrogenase class IV
MGLAFVHDALPGRIVFEPGARRRVPAEADRLGVERVLLIAGHGSSAAAAEEIRDALGDRCVGWYDEVRVHVPAHLARGGVTAARETGADALVCVGGGSATGMAKAIALELALPIVAVPTTYAGSEMTPIWGTTSDRRKHTGRDLRVLPRTVIYDPELTLSLPPPVAGPSGMNAMAHCVEALYAPNTNPMMCVLAEEGIRALRHGLPALMVHGHDIDARSTVLYGAYLAGASLAVAGTSIHHKIAHILGGAWNLPHAPLHAILLPHCVAFVAPAARTAMERIARALNAADAPSALFDLLDALGVDPRLTSIGMPADAFDDAVQMVVAAQPESPRPVERAAVATLLRRALDGKPPA